MPFDEAQNAYRTFKTYSNYVLSADLIVQHAYGSGNCRERNIVTTVRALPAVRRIKRIPDGSSPVDLGKELHLAWSFETALAQVGVRRDRIEPEDLLGTDTHAYYAVDSAARSFFVASNMMVSDSHTPALRKLNEQLVQRSLVPAPWNLYCTGEPQRGTMRLSGLPPGIAVRSVSNLGTPSTANMWDFMSLLLGTTRAKSKTTGKERPQRGKAPPQEAKKPAAEAHPTTIFDFLWRLRTRSHYRDAKSIFLGVTSYEAANDYYRALLSVVSATLTAIETLIVCYRGPEAYAAATAPLIARDVPRRSGNAAMAARFGLLAGGDASESAVDMSPAIPQPDREPVEGERVREASMSRR